MSLVRFRSEAPVKETQQGFQYAAVAHLVERHLAKVEVASSSLVGRSRQNKPLQNMIRRVMQRLFCTLKAFLELEKEGKTQ